MPGLSAVKGDLLLTENPSLTRLSKPVLVGEKSIAETWSQTMRLISSGMDLLKERSPASICTIGVCIFEAAMAADSVEFVSP